METTTLQRQCDSCGRTFEMQALNQRYCSTNCKVRMERQRRRAREAAPTVQPHTAAALSPTDETLHLWSLNYIADPKRAPIVFHGEFNRAWQPPDGIVFAESADGGMIMGSKEILG